MELLGALEKKIEGLIALVKGLQEEKARLLAENATLQGQAEQLEKALLKKNEDYKEWDKEKASARKAVDELIADIDSLIEGESSNG